MNDRIKFSGHTMGAPKCDIFEVIELFKSIGYDGIEVRVAADGQIDSEKLTDEEARKIYAAARAKGMEFSCLTSYCRSPALPSGACLWRCGTFQSAGCLVQ